MTMNRRFGLTMAAWLFLGVVFLPPAAQAYDGWVFRVDLGGWLDVNTGLVWGQWTNAEGSVGYVHYDYATKTWLPAYRLATGNPSWRLPTAVELEDAYRKDARNVVLGNATSAYLWSSTTKGKNVWVSDWTARINGDKSGYYLGDKNNIASAIPVYRAF